MNLRIKKIDYQTKLFIYFSISLFLMMCMPIVAKAEQSCAAPITATSLTLEAQVDSITFTVIQNDVQQLQIAIDWGDGTSLTGGAGEYTHSYYAPGAYTATISAAGYLGGLPCYTPPTVFAEVTVTECASCEPPNDVLHDTQPPGIYKPFADLEAQKYSQCGNIFRTVSDQTYISRLRVSYAYNVLDVPDGWPIITFCANREGLVHIDERKLQGNPWDVAGLVDTFDVFVHAGANALIPPYPGLPPGSVSFGYLGFFYEVVSNQTKTEYPLRYAFQWWYSDGQDQPSGPLPRVIPLGASTSVQIKKGK